MKRKSDDALERQEERMQKILCRCTTTTTSGSSYEEEEEEDRISKLHDELLVSILSQLSAQGDIDQAARTSILSSRWRNLWRFSLKNLRFIFRVSEEFMAGELMCGDNGERLYKTMCNEFVDRVNRVLELHLGDSIDDFHLVFFLADLARYSSDIDAWLSFALRKKVKRLSVDLAGSRRIYSLTPEKLIMKGVDTTLVSLRLKMVQITGKSVEYILSVFHSLEDLSVSLSNVLEDLTVSGPSLKLKHLDIDGCMKLKRLHVHGVVNLVSFKYRGHPDTCVTIQETPHLVSSSIFYFKKNNATLEILTQIPQLEMLLLDFSATAKLERVPEFPPLRKLKQLELTLYNRIFIRSLCARLLEASPSLTELKLRLRLLRDSDKEEEVEGLTHPHQHLKVVELHGFVGCQLDLGVALYIIENTQSLEKMIVDTSHPYREDLEGLDVGEAAGIFARQHLQGRLPCGTDFVLR